MYANKRLNTVIRALVAIVGLLARLAAHSENSTNVTLTAGTRAVALAPEFPEDRLNLAEACWQWRDVGSTRREVDLVKTSLTKARTQFQGDEWARA